MQSPLSKLIELAAAGWANVEFILLGEFSKHLPGHVAAFLELLRADPTFAISVTLGMLLLMPSEVARLEY